MTLRRVRAGYATLGQRENAEDVTRVHVTRFGADVTRKLVLSLYSPSIAQFDWIGVAYIPIQCPKACPIS